MKSKQQKKKKQTKQTKQMAAIESAVEPVADLRVVFVRMPEELHTRLKLAAIERDSTMRKLRTIAHGAGIEPTDPTREPMRGSAGYIVDLLVRHFEDLDARST